MAKKGIKSKTTSLLSIKKVKIENIINNAPMVKTIDDIEKLVDYICNNKARISESLFCEIILKKVSGFELRNELMKKVRIRRPKTKKVKLEIPNQVIKSQKKSLNKNHNNINEITIYDEYRDITKKILDKNKKDENENKLYENFDYGLSDW